MQHKVLETIDFGCSEAHPLQPFSPVACALALCHHRVSSPFSYGTWQLFKSLSLLQSQCPRSPEQCSCLFPIYSIDQNSRLMPVYTMALMCPELDLVFPAEWFIYFDFYIGLVKSVVLLKHTCRRKFNCFFYAFDCCWLGICSCLDTKVLTILAVVYTDWRIPARNVSHRKLKMKPRRDY